MNELTNQVAYENLNMDSLLNIIKQQSSKINAANIDDLIEDGIISANKLSKKQSSIFTSNVQIYKNKPSLILNSSTVTDTDWYITAYNDADATDNDPLYIGTGTVPGTNVRLSITSTGDVEILTGSLTINEGYYLYWASDTTPTQYADAILTRTNATNFQWKLRIHPYSYAGSTLEMLSFYHTESPLSNLLVIAANANMAVTVGDVTAFFPAGSGNFGVYYNSYLFAGRDFRIARTTTDTIRVFSNNDSAGAFAYLDVGDTRTSVPVGLRLFAGSATARVVIENTGAIKIASFSVAGFVKNAADGTISGGNSISPLTSPLETAGIQSSVVVTAINYTALTTDDVIVVTATATVTLPAATGTGQTYRIICRAGTTTVDGAGVETIKGETTVVLTAGEDLIISDTASGIWE